MSIVEINCGTVVTHLDGASVFSYETTVDLPLETVTKSLEVLIRAIQKQVNDSGGIVGHIKAFAQENGRSAVLSSTGNEVHVISGSTGQTDISFTAIVFCVNETDLRDQIDNLFLELENSSNN